MRLTVNIDRSLLCTRDAKFDESKITRAENGQFGSGGGSSARSRVSAALAKKESVPEEKRFLEGRRTREYTNSREEVYISDLADLGVKKLTQEDAERLSGEWKTGIDPRKTEIQRVLLSDIKFSQPSVNKGKLEYFAENYDPHPSQFHRYGKNADFDAPEVFRWPDGTLTSQDHHRLIASLLRGDTHALASVVTVSGDKKRGFSQESSSKDPEVQKMLRKKR